MAHKLDIFELLGHLDARDTAFFDSLTDEQKKSFAPIVALRWMSAAKDDNGMLLFVVNQIANKNFYDLYDHPELQYKLLAACGGGYKRRHEWIPMAKVPGRQDPVTDFIQSLHPGANDFEIGLVRSQLDAASFATLLDDCGVPPQDQKKLRDAFEKEA